jgi:hypothetical protein
MLSSTSFTLNLNLEPFVGLIETVPGVGNSLSTLFQIKINEV